MFSTKEKTLKLFKEPPPSTHKPPLTYDELREIIDLSLWAGQLLLQHGADSQRIEEAVHHIGTGLGCDWLDILISPNALIITASSAGEFRTKTRRVVSMGVNLGVLAHVSDLSYRINRDELDREGLRRELRFISDHPPQYNPWLTAAMVGMGCAAFSRLFGGDLAVFMVTFIAAALAMIVRQTLSRLYFNPFLVVIATAFTAGLIASSTAFFDLSPQPQTALAASALLLVPGVPLINAAQDLIRGHVVIGATRGIIGALISLSIAIGLILAMSLTGVSGL